MQKSVRGFTIVELLIVIVVIAILAAISIVAYNGIQQRAQNTTLQSDLANAAKAIELHNAEHGNYPGTLPSQVKTNGNNVLQLTATTNGFCINGYGTAGRVASYNTQGHRTYLCGGALIGSPVGGSIPPVPAGVNLVSDFSTWELTGGVTYNASNNQICVSNTTGSATSPLIRIEGSTASRFIVEAYATQSSPIAPPDSRGYYGSRYFGTDGTTPATSSAGYTSNGNAQVLPLSTWTTHNWSISTGSTVKYIRYLIHSSPTNYTSDNCYRNPQVLAIVS